MPAERRRSSTLGSAGAGGGASARRRSEPPCASIQASSSARRTRIDLPILALRSSPRRHRSRYARRAIALLGVHAGQAHQEGRDLLHLSQADELEAAPPSREVESGRRENAAAQGRCFEGGVGNVDKGGVRAPDEPPVGEKSAVSEVIGVGAPVAERNGDLAGEVIRSCRERGQRSEVASSGDACPDVEVVAAEASLGECVGRAGSVRGKHGGDYTSPVAYSSPATRRPAARANRGDPPRRPLRRARR
jgi:hypothetical protein